MDFQDNGEAKAKLMRAKLKMITHHSKTKKEHKYIYTREISIKETMRRPRGFEENKHNMIPEIFIRYFFAREAERERTEKGKKEVPKSVEKKSCVEVNFFFLRFC